MNDSDVNNPYRPPSTTQFVQALQYRTDYGFGLAWSLFWRVLLLQWFGTWAVSALRYVSIANEVPMQVTIFGTFAVISALPLFFTRRGAIFFLFGDRIALPVAAWRKFHWLLSVYYGVMAAWNLVVYYVLGGVTPAIRITIPVILLVVFFAIVPRSLRAAASSQDVTFGEH